MIINLPGFPNSQPLVDSTVIFRELREHPLPMEWAVIVRVAVVGLPYCVSCVLSSFVLCVLLLGGEGQMVQMDSSKSGFVGSQVELRCIFINSNPPVKISQVTWQKLLNGTKQNVAIANPALGVSVLPPFKERVSFKQAAVRHRTPSLEDTTIVFSNLQLSDEAAYICEYTTFPAGNRENMVNLTVFGKNSP